MTLKLCKLVDGSLVLGDWQKDFLTDVLEVRLQQTEQGVGVGFIPLLFPFNTGFGDITIDKSKVIYYIDPPQELADNYIKETTGIIPASVIPSHLKSNLSIVK